MHIRFSTGYWFKKCGIKWYIIRCPWPKISDAIRALLQAKIQHINAIIHRWWTWHTKECWFCPYD